LHKEKFRKSLKKKVFKSIHSFLAKLANETKMNTMTGVCTCNQFHQHSTYKFFVLTLLQHLFSSYMYVEKAAKTMFVRKNPREKCWWNWHLSHLKQTCCIISKYSLFIAKISWKGWKCRKINYGLSISTTIMITWTIHVKKAFTNKNKLLYKTKFFSSKFKCGLNYCFFISKLFT